MRTYQIRTYGCQMNFHDSERLAGLLEEAGYRRAGDGDAPTAPLGPASHAPSASPHLIRSRRFTIRTS